jgi:hypothetical protein
MADDGQQEQQQGQEAGFHFWIPEALRKTKIPNPKHQIPNKFQIPNSNVRNKKLALVDEWTGGRVDGLGNSTVEGLKG